MAHIISITDFDTPELDVYARLTENQLVNRADPANAPLYRRKPAGHRAGAGERLRAGVLSHGAHGT